MEQIKALFKNKKFLRIFIPVLVIVLGLVGFIYYKLSDDSIAVETATVKMGTVQQYYDTTGTLSSAETEKFYLYDGVVVKEVFFKSGDTVNKGDVLATFDTSSMNSLISEKREAYNEASKNYNNAVADANDTAARIKEIDNEIADLEAQKKDIEAASSESAGATSTTVTNAQNTSDDNQSLADILSGLANSTDDTTGDTTSGSSENELSDEEIAALMAALQNSNATQGLTSAQAIDTQISMLESEKSMMESGQTSTLVTAYKQSMESAKADYNAVISEKESLDEGFIASATGKVAEVNIRAGEAYVYVEDESENTDILSMLSGDSSKSGSLSPDIADMLSGMGVTTGVTTSSVQKGIAMTVDYFDGYKISFNLGKYDVQTVGVGMPAVIEYTDYEYEGEVTYISPYAQGGASAITSMMGGTSTSTSAVPAEVTITNPDDKLILGFDAKLSILVAEHPNVLTIPVEALVISEGEKFVYIYDADKEIAVKTNIEVDASSETHYEVTKGLSEGDIVIVNSSKVTDGDSVTIEE